MMFDSQHGERLSTFWELLSIVSFSVTAFYSFPPPVPHGRSGGERRERVSLPTLSWRTSVEPRPDKQSKRRRRLVGTRGIDSIQNRRKQKGCDISTSMHQPTECLAFPTKLSLRLSGSQKQGVARAQRGYRAQFYERYRKGAGGE